jgi:hypothetical protein
MNTYSFQYRDTTRALREGFIVAASKDGAYLATMADTRLKNCKILKGTFRCHKTGNDVKSIRCHKTGNDVKSITKTIEQKAYKDFLKYLNLAIENLYVCNMENNAAVLSMDIKSLYSELKNFDPFA